LNRTILIGVVTRGPDIRTPTYKTQNDKEIASFSLQTFDEWMDKKTGEKKKRIEYHKIVVFVPQYVELLKKGFVKPGTKVYLEGSLQTRKWQDNTNTDKYITEVLLQSYNSVLLVLSDIYTNENGESSTKDDLSVFDDDNIPY
jgi:single-strand DNA-binding protein